MRTNSFSRKARQRLMREAADLAANPEPLMNAVPLEHDIFTWHANIVHMGVPFHFEITFTEDYPRTAPKVHPLTYIEHPNVFGDYICLDILTMSVETENTPYRGWTPAYTIRSLLIQLHCFLFDVENSDYDKASMRTSAKIYLCHACGHCGRNPVPHVDVQSVRFSPGIYRCKRAALCRESHLLSSVEVCTLEQHTAVEIIRTEGRRALVKNVEFFEEAWCSAVTDSGTLLGSIAKKPLGVYEARDFTNLFALVPSESQEKLNDLQKIGSCDKGSHVTVTGFVTFGKDILSIAESEDFDVDAYQVLVFSSDLNLIREESETSEIEEYNGVINEDSSWLHEMYGLVLDVVFDMCDSQTAQALAMVHEDFQAKLDNCRAYQLRNFRCFYTLKDVRDSTTILGIGVNCEVMPKRSRVTRKLRDVLQRMHPSFDLMSLEAFEQHNCLNSIWKDVNFNAFMPLYLCPEHGRRALPAAEKCILKMWQMENQNNSLSLSRLLETFAKLMNTTIVNMMKNVMDLEVEELQLFDSIKALEGYMSFHHLLLAFTQRKPQLIKLADEKVQNFIEDPACRDKEVTPDLGELIVCLSISSYKWEDFTPALLDELFQRNVRWILAKYPGLRNLEPNGKRSCIRMTQSFQATITGKRLACFQRFFMKEIACPVALEGNSDKCKILFEEYNSRFGRPVPGMARRLQLHSRKVLAMSDWWDYFDLIGFCAPSSISLSNWLRNSVKLSAAREYHSTYQVLKYTENHVESPDYSHHEDHRNCVCCGGQVYNLAKKYEAEDVIAKPKERIDIAFVVDCTGSMSSWLRQAKKQIRKIIEDVTAKTQFKRVRFALVCYRDHGREGGYGSDKYVTKSMEFTANAAEAQKYVDSMKTGGGGDVEALSSGLHAAASLKWNEEAMRIIVHIGDQVAHGMGSPYDSFADGCPDGHDALKIAHNLAKKGVVIYNVDCGWEDGLRQTFYHTLSYLTGGVCLSIQDAHALSQIVIGATMEEEVQNVLAGEVAKIYDDVVARHPGAREDQLVYELAHRLKMNGVKVKTTLGNQTYDKWEKKQIDCMAFCTDLTQIKAMQEQAGEYFDRISVPENQFVSEAKRFPNERQVRTCLKRSKKSLQMKSFLENGCQFAQKRWKLAAFKARWEPFKEMSQNIGKFAPWVPPGEVKLIEAGRNIKRAAELSRKGTKFFNNGRTGIKTSAKPQAWNKPVPQASKKEFSWSTRMSSPQEPVKTTQAQQPPVRAQVQQPLRRPQVPTRAPQFVAPARRSPSQQSRSQTRQSPARVQPVNPNTTARIFTVQYDPSHFGKIGLSLNIADGMITNVDTRFQFVTRFGVCAGTKILALNGQSYNAPLYNHLCNMGRVFSMTFAVPITNAPVTQQMPGPQNFWNRARNQNSQNNSQNAPARNNLTVHARSAPRRSASSSGSPHQLLNSHSRTPERTAPVQVVPDLDMALKITSRTPLNVESIKTKFRFACVYPKEIKTVNQFCAYAIFDSVFSTRLAARSDLGRDVKVQLARETRV